MASWSLACKNCGAAFTFSKIGETLADHFIPLRPDFPAEGVKRECPSCKVTSSYQRNELTYRSD